MAEKIGYLDRITNRAAALGALFVGITALMNSVSDLFGKLREKWVILQQLPWWSQWAVSAFLVIIAFYLIRAAFAGKSRLLRPERFLIQPDEPRFLKGREHEVQELGQLCDREPLVFLDGESGCGKSALICAGLLPWCEADPARPLPLRIDLSGAPWDNGIAKLLGRTLWIEKGDLCQELEYKQYPQADAVFQALIQIGERTARMPLLIFDQFDDYQTAYREHFYPAGGSRLLASQEFFATNLFWSQVARGVMQRHWHCLVITRNDTRAGLDAIRFCDARSYTLSRVDQNLIAPLFDEITAPGPDNAPVVDQPELSWNPLRERLLSDLANQEGQILPIQLAVSLDAMRRWRFLTDAQYRTEGGLSGLERLHVQGYVQETAHATGLSVATLIAVLLRLTDPVRKKARRASFNALVQPLIGVSPDVLQQALIMLEERRIVRRVAHAEEAGGEAWLLYHDYLARGVIEAHRSLDKWRLLLDEYAGAWQRVDGWWEKWRRLLPVRTQARLTLEILRQRLRIGTHWRYMAWSTLRFVPALVITAAVFLAYDWITLQQDLQVVKSTIAALDNNQNISENEAAHFRKLIGASWRAKQRVLQDVLENEQDSDRALPHADVLAHVILGLDKTGERSSDVIRMSLETLASAQSKMSSLIFASRLLAHVRVLDPQALTHKLLEQLKTQKNLTVLAELVGTISTLNSKLELQTLQVLPRDLPEPMEARRSPLFVKSLTDTVLDLVSKQDPQAAQALARDLSERMKTEQNSEIRKALTAAMSALVFKPGLNPQVAQALVRDVLLAWIKTELDPEAQVILARVMSVLASKLDPQAAQALVRGLPERMEAEGSLEIWTDFYAVLDLVTKLGLDPPAAQALFRDLLERMKTEKDPESRAVLAGAASALAGTVSALDPPAAQALFRDLLERMKTEEDSEILAALVRVVSALAPELDLEPPAAQALVRNLLERIENDYYDPAGTALAGAVSALAPKLDPPAAQALVRDLPKQIKDKMIKSKQYNGYYPQPLLPSYGIAKSKLALAALAYKLEPQTSQALAREFLDWMKSEQNRPVFVVLVRVVSVLVPKIDLQTVQSLTRELLGRIKSEQDLWTLEFLVDEISDLIPKLDPQTAQALVSALLERMKSEHNSNALLSLAKLALTLESQLTPNSPVQLQNYVDLLKGYAGIFLRVPAKYHVPSYAPTSANYLPSYAPAYFLPLAKYPGVPIRENDSTPIGSGKVILDIIEIKTGQKFNGDKWRFVEWATSKDAAKFHLDLD